MKRDTTRADRGATVPLCRPCHNQVHALFTEKELEREYNTLDRLRNHPDMIKWIDWVSKRRFGATVR